MHKYEKSTLAAIITKVTFLCQVHYRVFSKGAPARESCTGTQLVSPAKGCEKKRKPLEQGLGTQS